MDQLQDMKNTYKWSICCALQPAKPATHEALFLLTASPHKKPRETGKGSVLEALAVINKPEIDNNVMLDNSQVGCFLTQMWPKDLTSLRLSVS